MDKHDRIEYEKAASLLFLIAGQALRSEPTVELCRSLMQEDLFNEAPYANESEEVRHGLESLSRWQRVSATVQERTDELAVEWLRLFGGVGRPLAVPWRSVYTSPDKLLFTGDTLAVRSLYRSYGLAVDELNREPDDQIGLLLIFLSHMIQHEIDAIEADKAERERSEREAQRNFIGEFMLPWISRWRDSVREHDRTLFFSGIADLIVGACHFRFAELTAIDMEVPSEY